MKTLEEFQVTTDELSGALFVQALAGEIEKDALAATVAINLVKINRELVGNPGKSISFPKRTGVAFAAITENASATLVTPSYTTVDVTPTKRGGNVDITNEALEASRFDVVEEVLDSLARAAAQAKNTHIIDVLLDRLTDVATIAGTEDSTAFTLSVGNIINVIEITISGTTQVASTDYTVDHKDGVIHLVVTIASGGLVTYEYAQSITMVESDTAGVLSGRDVLAAVAEVRAANYDADSLLVHPAQYADLLNEQRFYDSSQFGTPEAQKTGHLRVLYGLKVYVTTAIQDGVAIVIDTSRAAKLVMKRDLTVKFDEDITLDKRIVAATEMYAAAVINAGAICLIGGMNNEDGRS